MNHTFVTSRVALEELLEELTAYKRPISYNLSEIKILSMPQGWLVIWRKDGK